MIKFFRKIREKHLSQNKFSKYILYAFGEIILVMFGILMALQVNTWNQKRLDSHEERLMLQAIQNKMKQNRFQTETGVVRYNAVINASKQLIKISKDQLTGINHDEVNYYFHVLSKRFLVGNSNKTSIYDEIIGTGKLNLLKSKKLRSELTSLKANMELLASYEDLQTSFVDGRLSPFLNEHTDRLSIAVNGYKEDASDYDSIFAASYSDIKILNRTTSHAEVLNDQILINLLTELIYHTTALLPIYSRIDKNISTIESLASSQ